MKMKQTLEIRICRHKDTEVCKDRHCGGMGVMYNGIYCERYESIPKLRLPTEGRYNLK